MTRKKLVLIGNGMAGIRTVEELLKLAPDLYDITVFGAEPYGNYNRIQLSPVLAGELGIPQIMLNDLAWYEEHNIRVHLGCEVQTIDRIKRQVIGHGAISAPYDRLLLAMGSTPFVPNIAGADLPGVVSYRDIRDTERMIDASKQYRRAVVIGGGLLGLEAASGLARRGMQVTVLHLMPCIMERQLDPTSAGVLQRSLEDRGLKFVLNAKTSSLSANANGDRVGAVHLDDGSSIEAELVVFAAGIRPRAELARAAGLHCNRGVVVNDVMQTFDPRIYAVGECAEHRGIAYGLVAPLYEQAKVCANHLALHGIGSYGGSIMSTRLKVTGIEVFSAGDFALDPTTEDVVLYDPQALIYKRAVIRDDRLVGAVMVGDTSQANWLTRLIASQERIGGIRNHLLFGAPEDLTASQ